jgi:hypothetical protein
MQTLTALAFGQQRANLASARPVSVEPGSASAAQDSQQHVGSLGHATLRRSAAGPLAGRCGAEETAVAIP